MFWTEKAFINIVYTKLLENVSLQSIYLALVRRSMTMKFEFSLLHAVIIHTLTPYRHVLFLLFCLGGQVFCICFTIFKMNIDAKILLPACETDFLYMVFVRENVYLADLQLVFLKISFLYFFHIGYLIIILRH